MENNLSNLILQKGLQNLPRRKFLLQETDRYICIKPFDEIENNIYIFAGIDKNTGNYIISEKGFEELQIGSGLFNEHFEYFILPTFIEYKNMNKKQKKDLTLKYFSNGK